MCTMVEDEKKFLLKLLKRDYCPLNKSMNKMIPNFAEKDFYKKIEGIRKINKSYFDSLHGQTFIRLMVLMILIRKHNSIIDTTALIKTVRDIKEKEPHNQLIFNFAMGRENKSRIDHSWTQKVESVISLKNACNYFVHYIDHGWIWHEDDSGDLSWLNGNRMVYVRISTDMYPEVCLNAEDLFLIIGNVIDKLKLEIAT